MHFWFLTSTSDALTLQALRNTCKQVTDSIDIKKVYSPRGAILYCSKARTREDGPYTKNIRPDMLEEEKVRDPMAGLEKREWQYALDQYVAEGGDGSRAVLWIVDEAGAAGKTMWCKSRYIHDAHTYYLAGGSESNITSIFNQTKIGEINQDRRWPPKVGFMPLCMGTSAE